MKEEKAMKPVFRVSRGSFPPEKFEAVRKAFAASRATLEPATRRLRGHRATYTAIDAASGSIVYVSFWDDIDAAKQLGTLPEMQAAGAELIKLGVEFERPIINYETLWSIE
jgi:hypothetical protein